MPFATSPAVLGGSWAWLRCSHQFIFLAWPHLTVGQLTIVRNKNPSGAPARGMRLPTAVGRGCWLLWGHLLPGSWGGDWGGGWAWHNLGKGCCSTTSSVSSPGLWWWRASLMLCNSVLCVPSTEGSKILLLFITNNFIIVLVNTVFLRQTTGTPALVCRLLGCAVWLWALPGTVLAVPMAHPPCPPPAAGEQVPYTSCSRRACQRSP